MGGHDLLSPFDHYEFLAYWEFLKGDLSGSIHYLEFALEQLGSTYREVSGLYGSLARYYAIAGDFNGADEAIEGVGRGISGVP